MKEHRTKKVRHDFPVWSTFFLILVYCAAFDATLAAKKVSSTTANPDQEVTKIDTASTASNTPEKVNFYLPADLLFEPPDLGILKKNKTKKAKKTKKTKKTKTKEPEDDSVNKTEKFIDACQEEIEKGVILTENQAKTYCTSDNPVVDFFFHIMEQTSPQTTLDLLEKSWAYSPDDTIRLIANLRDIRGGKNIKYQSMFCFYWLYKNHPLTLYNNLEYVVKVGYWKDLLHIMMTILFDGHVGEHLQFDDCPDNDYYRKKPFERRNACFKRGRLYSDKVLEYFGQQSNKSLDFDDMQKLNWQFGKDKFESDPKYRLFHVKIAQLFADQLKKDIQYLEANKTNRISLCAKWSPSDEKHFDRFSLIKTSISAKLLDEDHKILKDYKTITEGLKDKESLQICQSAFAYSARKECEKKYVKPLREACKVPELYMQPGKWCKLDYNRVPSKCMMKNKKSFIKHDEDRFSKFVKKAKKVAGATLKPVELVEKIMTEGDALTREVYEKQWISIVESLSGKGGLFESALSICDVSGSMTGTPMHAALGLTLLTSQLSKFPWSSVCMTFSGNPQFHNISGSSLHDKLTGMSQMDWQMNTNVDAAFELILTTAINHKLKSEDLPKILFLFTDMEFDSCVQSDKTNFQHIKERFVEEGYQLPAVIFWKLDCRAKLSTPVKSSETGFILISGFSPKLLSEIMNCKDISEVTPFLLVNRTLQKYHRFKVFD